MMKKLNLKNTLIKAGLTTALLASLAQGYLCGSNYPPKNPNDTIKPVVTAPETIRVDMGNFRIPNVTAKDTAGIFGVYAQNGSSTSNMTMPSNMTIKEFNSDIINLEQISLFNNDANWTVYSFNPNDSVLTEEFISKRYISSNDVLLKDTTKIIPIWSVDNNGNRSDTVYTVVEFNLKNSLLLPSYVNENNSVKKFSKRNVSHSMINLGTKDIPNLEVIVTEQTGSKSIELGETINIDGKEYTLLGANADNHNAILKIGSTQKTVSEGNTYTIGGQDVLIKSLYITTIPTTSALIEVVKLPIKTKTSRLSLGKLKSNEEVGFGYKFTSDSTKDATTDIISIYVDGNDTLARVEQNVDIYDRDIPRNLNDLFYQMNSEETIIPSKKYFSNSLSFNGINSENFSKLIDLLDIDSDVKSDTGIITPRHTENLVCIALEDALKSSNKQIVDLGKSMYNNQAGFFMISKEDGFFDAILIIGQEAEKNMDKIYRLCNDSTYYNDQFAGAYKNSFIVTVPSNTGVSKENLALPKTELSRCYQSNNGIRIEYLAENNLPTSIKIVDVAGRTIYSQNGMANKGPNAVNINKPLANGIYIVNAKIGKDTFSKKVPLIK
ncbi:MAG: T9SS type A sorting domain-containing protein [Candidatus Woesearchaeota archaeon]|jgi:hypothetical protein